ncbi:MAG TPA: glycosyltransferase family 2 protein [Candidatus Hydrogenedentes bacterium]|nr:glycosyltransferase family 2 protein [Candidatus Hydrogenedentota bacterium]HIJ74461.1 glycosyltransferase family 2 protein [Candidatus Hydrogenedentota bacterium]
MSDQTRARPDLSVVIPVFNEEDNLQILYERLTSTLKDCGKTYEILFVEDGSTDASFDALKRLFEGDAAVRVIRFARNFGQQMAISAGFQHASGNAVVLLDADLQVAPEEIAKVVDKLREGYDIVYGVRTHRIDPLLRRVGSWCMSHLLYRITGIDVPDSATGFTALDRRFVESINLFNDKSKYLSGLFAWLSYGRYGEVPVAHAARRAGKSKYTLPQLIALGLNFICNFTMMPLRFAFYVGWVFALPSGAALLWLAATRLLGFEGADNDTWLIVLAIAFFAGVQLVSIGILGEYLGRVYREVREQPPFVVREVLDHEKSGAGD